MACRTSSSSQVRAGSRLGQEQLAEVGHDGSSAGVGILCCDQRCAHYQGSCCVGCFVASSTGQRSRSNREREQGQACYGRDSKDGSSSSSSAHQAAVQAVHKLQCSARTLPAPSRYHTSDKYAPQSIECTVFHTQPCAAHASLICRRPPLRYGLPGLMYARHSLLSCMHFTVFIFTLKAYC
jgi:hypothetical protein